MKVMKNVMVNVVFLFGSLAILALCSCDEENDSEEGIPYPELMYTTCEQIVNSCIDESPWYPYITSVQQCNSLYQCMLDLYSSECRALLNDTFECASAIETGDQCQDCNYEVSLVQENCSYPEECL